MTRTTENAKIHIRLITAMVNRLMGEGYTVSADHIGYPNGKPDSVLGHIPDISAEKEGKKIYFEAETRDSLTSPQTKVKWVALSSSEDAKFSIIVPENCVEETKKLAKKWGVKVETFWTMKTK